jgi:hypothetical protein
LERGTFQYYSARLAAKVRKTRQFQQLTQYRQREKAGDLGKWAL